VILPTLRYAGLVSSPLPEAPPNWRGFSFLEVSTQRRAADGNVRPLKLEIRCRPLRPAWEAKFALPNARDRGLNDVAYMAGCSFRWTVCPCQALFVINGIRLLNEKWAVSATAEPSAPTHSARGWRRRFRRSADGGAGTRLLSQRDGSDV
jgi:hypothetical protein